MKNIKKNYKLYINKIKESGFKLTRTRKVILDIFLENPEKLCAEEIYFLANKKYLKIGLTTIYRTIKILEKIGAITVADFKNGKIKYRLEKRSVKKV